jgi:DNA integrity scanning protein DisA with diadenylate cyclase activity
MNNKIIVPKQVANAIAHYVALADSKHEAFTDILRFGYESERSELILRHFAHDFDELMEALICGYEVAEDHEEKVRDYFESYNRPLTQRFIESEQHVIAKTLNLLGIKIDGGDTQ